MCESVVESCAMRNGKEKILLERLFRALADRTRLRLLNLMGDDEVCVCFFVEILGMSQPRVSRHLAYLKKAGIVASRRDGKWMHYRVASPADADAARILADVRESLGNDQEMRRERQKLVKFCCSTKLPPALQDAPLPMLTSQAGSCALRG